LLKQQGKRAAHRDPNRVAIARQVDQTASETGTLTSWTPS